MNLKDYKHIHLIGIGGINVSAIAKLMLAQGKKVSGSDLAATDLTRELEALGAKVYLGHKRENIAPDVGLIIYSDAVPQNNPERLVAEEKKIEVMSAFKFWGEYAKDKKVVAISGTNGKSTTTAMVGFIMAEAGLDPTVVVGTKVLQWGSNIRIGKSDWLVIEADEYHAHMLEFKPRIAVITNIAPDHLDYYKDLDDIVAHFQKWVEHLPKDGGAVINLNNPASKQLRFNAPVVTFSLGGAKGLRSAGLTVRSGYDSWTGDNSFNIVDDKKDWGIIDLSLPGTFNIENALAAAATADLLGIRRSKIRKALSMFKGTWRRFEIAGEYQGALVISDYAHHPDGVKATLEAARGWYPHQRLVLLYQPHQHNRTRKLFDEFVKSFDEVDELILAEIYDVAGRENSEDQKVSSKDLVEAIKARLRSSPPSSDGAGLPLLGEERESKNLSPFQGEGGVRVGAQHLTPDHISYAPDLQTAEQILRSKIQPDDIVIIMGAGDVDLVARNLAG